MRLSLLATLFFILNANAQYHFSGSIDNDTWQNSVYLSLIEDYRKIEGIYTEQIIAKVTADSTGSFEFIGNQLELKNRIYKIHVDNCFKDDKNHFNEHCNNSKAILFIAKNTDTISFPFAFDSEMFCEIKSKNKSTTSLIDIDILKEDMSFDYASFRSETNRKLNNKKWFKKLQEYGKNLNEPLAEIYIYDFLTHKSAPFYSYYLEDLSTNSYYDELLQRLQKTYPNTNYTKQYKTELAADKFTLNTHNTSSINWSKLIAILLVFSVLLNIWFLYQNKKKKSKKTLAAKEQLTKQEQKIVDLLLNDKTNKEIAQELFVSVSTVKTHLNNIYKKLNIQSRIDIKQLFNI